MPYQLKKDSRILVDILEAVSYYDAISLALGEKFEESLLLAINKIEKYPHHYFNLLQKFRRVNIQNFPYMLIYIVQESSKEIIILGLFHHYRDSKLIRRRLK